MGLTDVRARWMRVPLEVGRELVERRTVDMLQHDLAVYEGVTRGQRIEALTATDNRRVRSAYVGRSARVRYRLAPGRGKHRVSDGRALAGNLTEEGFTVKNGRIDTPGRPSLGITVSEDVVREVAVTV